MAEKIPQTALRWWGSHGQNDVASIVVTSHFSRSSTFLILHWNFRRVFPF